MSHVQSAESRPPHGGGRPSPDATVTMRAIVISAPGGPEKLVIERLPRPVPRPGEVLVRVRAFGVNHAETHMRKGEWPEATPVSGIECAGTVAHDPAGLLAEGGEVPRRSGRPR